MHVKSKAHLCRPSIRTSVRDPKQGHRFIRSVRVVGFDGVTRRGEPRGVTGIRADFRCPGEGAADDLVAVEHQLWACAAM
jgi:hypothetical protein